MLWVDQDTYCGPDRRREKSAGRLLNRRRENLAGPPPHLLTALRQLRQRVIDARGAGVDRFIQRARGVAILARLTGERSTAAALGDVSELAARNRHTDMREALHRALDRAQALLSRPY